METPLYHGFTKSWPFMSHCFTQTNSEGLNSNINGQAIVKQWGIETSSWHRDKLLSGGTNRQMDSCKLVAPPFWVLAVWTWQHKKWLHTWYDLKYLCRHWTSKICATTRVTIKMRTISACMASWPLCFSCNLWCSILWKKNFYI